MKKLIKMYDTLWDNFDNSIVIEASKLLSIRFKRNKIPLNLIKGKKVLDMGCGSGRYSVALKILGAKEVIGVDKGDGKKFYYDGVKYLKGDVLNLPFEDESFDFVFCNGVLMTTRNPEKGIKEMFRVLKPKGNAWLYVYGQSKIWDDIDIFRNTLKGKHSDVFKKILETYGFPPNKQYTLVDMFFVPYRSYHTKKQLEGWFKKIGFVSWRHLLRSTDNDFDERVFRKEKGYEYFKNINYRYLLRK